MAEIETIEVPKTLLPLMVTYIKQASALADDVEGQATKTASDKAELDKLSKAAASELLQSGLLERTSLDTAARALANDPAAALKTIIKVAKDIRPFHYGDAPAAAVETPRSDADRKFERALGL